MNEGRAFRIRLVGIDSLVCLVKDMYKLGFKTISSINKYVIIELDFGLNNKKIEYCNSFEDN